MKSNKVPDKPIAKSNDSRRARRLRSRLREINARGEKELAAIFDHIEKAKAAFRAKKQ